MGSNVQSQFFETRSVLVAGAIVNSVMAISWRVRKGASWSAFASFSVYRPVVLLPPSLPPSAPVVLLPPSKPRRCAGSGGGASSSCRPWLAPTPSSSPPTRSSKRATSSNPSSLSLSLSLDACVAYWVRVALCSAACSILSEASSPITLAAYVVAPGAVQNLEVAALSSTSLRVQWAEPAELGGASIRYYVVRRSWMASMAVIQSESESESEVASTNCFLDLQSVQHAPIYLSVAAFTGYLSRQEKIPAVLYAVCVESGGGH